MTARDTDPCQEADNAAAVAAPGSPKPADLPRETVCVPSHAQPRNENFFPEAADSLRAAALEQLERMRKACEGEPDGVSVHDAVAHCMNHGIMPPPWLCSVFLTRRALVRDAHVDSWDKAFGKPFPKGARLAQIRLDRKRRAAVHAALWAEVLAGASLNDELCDRVGELPGIDASASTVWRRYGEAVAGGAMDLALWRASQDCQLSSKS